ncbi:uncharacterized protein LOC112179962 [Rosa chinensis]|uniref:uncharacterized protein LOC112179962 n=1 Tax=Rosa chinensis TaxID=74649 RepID=UPI001AD8F32C|nr:uncharacterized protein LOC112179962 [Rosa chinensis]
MHPAERQDYRAAVRRSTVDRDKNSQSSRSARFQFPNQSRGGSSSQQPQQVDRSKTYRYSFPEPPVVMPSKDSRSKQSTIKSLLKGGRELLATMVSKCNIYDAVPFTKADSPHFQNMLTTAGNLGPGVKLPTSYEIQTRYLENEYTEMKRYVDTHRETWKIYGCTIMCDGWTGPTKMSILNFMVYSKGSTVFLKSIDASHMKKNAQYIELLLDEIIQDVGPENVVRIVTDNA